MVESRIKEKMAHLTERKPQKLLNVRTKLDNNGENSPLDKSCQNAPLDLSFQKAALDLSYPEPKENKNRRQHQPSSLGPDLLVDINKCLPSEVLHFIFAMLPCDDLKKVLFVCRRWREVGEAAILWAGMELNISKYKKSIPQLLDCGRLSLVRKMTVHVLDTGLLQALARHRGLRELTVMSIALFYQQEQKVFDQLLGRLASSLSQLCLASNNLSVEQIESVLGALSGHTRLRRLNLGDNSKVHMVRPDMFSLAARQLEELNLQRTGVTVEQAEAILTVINSQSNTIKILNLSDCDKLTFGRDLSRVSPQLLARGACRLVSLNLSFIGLTSQQAGAIFTALGYQPSQLRRLVISDNDLSTVAPSLLATAVNQLELVNLDSTLLTGPQVEAILDQSFQKTSLKTLQMSNKFSLRDYQLDKKLLTRARQVIANIEMCYRANPPPLIPA